MEIHQIRYAVALSEELHFGRAAKRCYVSQPSLSVQIKKLEDEIGAPLFDRMGKKVSLTILGEQFLSHAHVILNRLEAAKNSATKLLDSDEGTIRLGVIPTVSPFWLPKILPHLRKELPKLEIIIREGTSEELAPRLLNGELDFAIGSLPVCHDSLSSIPLLEEDFVLGVPSNHKFAKKRSISLNMAMKEPWILLEDLHCMRQQIGDFCTKRRQLFDTVLETSQVQSLTGLVEAGLGITLVPRMATQKSKKISYIRLRPSGPTRRIGFVYHQDHFMPPVAWRFVKICKKITAQAV
ncbi:MAG: LysR family transcriptional regulator [Phycisphaeraceae bacterium]|nr:LysR family transcriptional regulator [Phycisphaeraceae bacterium]